MFMLTGEYNHQLDAKNRIRIPAKLKKEIGDEYYFAKGAGCCIAVLPKCTMEEYNEKIKTEIKITDIAKLKSVRALTSSIVSAEEDNQGRVVLNSSLKKFAKINKDIVIIGVADHAEIWAKEVYDEYFGDDDSQTYDELFQNLGI
jgi:MraZ protein